MDLRVSPSPGPAEDAPRSRLPRRLVLWVSLAVGLIVAVLVALLATVGQPSDTSRLVGAPAPALAGPSLHGGGRYSLAQLAGKWVLVDFAASWCVDCREELPQLKAFAASARHYDATILTVEEDPSDGASLAKYYASNGVSWPAIQDPAASASYGVTGIPAGYLVDPEGIVAAYFPAGVEPATLDAVITTAIQSGGSRK